jgi:hypothetical protein
MELDQLSGYWILEHREEHPVENSSFTIGNKTYNIQEVSLEILVFKTSDYKCFQLGIDLLPLEEQEDFKYDISAFLPGAYSLDPNKIMILEEGNFSISNGKLLIEESSENYTCKETWVRLDNTHHDLINFLDYNMNNM